MVRNFFNAVGILGCLLLIGFSVVEGRALESARPSPNQPNAATPAYCNTHHDVGRLALGVSNDGTFATQLAVSGGRDCFSGEANPFCEFPKDSRTSYCFGAALWMGAVVGRDTLVSTGADGWSRSSNEFHPDEPPFGNMIYRSTIDPARPEFDGAISEQDYIAVYRDTCTGCTGISNDFLDNRTHRPLNIEVTQRTFAWSYSYAQDFVLFDYAVKNIGTQRMHRVFMGIYVDADIHDLAIMGGQGAQDDFCGFREYQPALYMEDHCPPDSDKVNIAWTADNDGELGQMVFQTVPHITATRIVRTPSDSLAVSFNWWVSNGDPVLDFGPMTRATPRDLTTGGTGTPEGDRNKFYILSNGEFDYDQPRVATIGSLDSVWLPPQGPVDDWADGLDTRYVLSFGPFDIEPGQTLPISLAYVAGVNFHRSAENLDNLPHNPDSWYEGVNFDSLGSNATWADWVYDNPGVDTDNDGYAGESTICYLGGDSSEVCDTTWDSATTPPTEDTIICHYEYELADTVWRKGDGVPDFRGATPPPSPATYSSTNARGEITRGLRVIPEVGKLKVRWNGVLSENTPDVFSREIDFEGYRVFVGRDDRRASYSVVGSYDIEDFNRWDYSEVSEQWALNESPFTLERLRCLYAPDSCGDTTWNPNDWPRHHPLTVSTASGPEIYYFEPQDYNQSVLANYDNYNSPLKKRFPNAPIPPTLDVDSIRVLFPNGADSIYLTEDGFIMYYEYEFVIEKLLPTIPYWVNVTTFDYGSPSSGLAALETSPTLQPIAIYALDAPDENSGSSGEAFIWPNPYRLDGGYRTRGFEGRGDADRDDDRVRQIHFANLPDSCTIRIYSLDGDLVREFEHPARVEMVGGCPLTEHEACWDLITRNSQQVVSGLYYWTVEDREGNVQIGKLVVIL